MPRTLDKINLQTLFLIFFLGLFFFWEEDSHFFFFFFFFSVYVPYTPYVYAKETIHVQKYLYLVL